MIEIKENYLYVELLPDNAPSLDGYVKKEDLFEDGQEVISPYPSVVLTTMNDCAFYTDKNCRNAVTYLFKNRNLNFYGYYKTDENLYVYFVSYNGKLGYVKESDVSPFDVKNHPNELTFLDNSAESHETVGVFSPEEDVSTEKNETIKLVIVILLAFAGVLALFVALFPKKPKKEENYYDENDFF